MIRNYFLVALRALNGQRVNAIINLAGLSMGMACSIAIMLYVHSEWSYDRHYRDADRIYKVGISFFNIGNFAIGPEALGTSLPNNFDGIEAFTRVYHDPELAVQVGDEVHTELAYFTDSSFFKVFSYGFISGNPSTALRSPASLVLTREMSRRLFKEQDPLGKNVSVGKDKMLFTVTGVVEDDSRSSQLKSRLWLSNESKLKNEPVWTSAASYNYLKLKPHLTEADLALALDRILEKEVYPQASGVPQGISFEDYRKHENAVKFIIQPLRSVHLYSKLNYEISPTGNPENLTIFSGVSIIILLLAAINFINLTTAQGARRAKEIGVRKTMGASQLRLIFQFVLESVITCLLALPLSLVLCEGILQLFNLISGEQLVNPTWLSFSVVMALMGFVLILGILAGIYPAFILTSLKPVTVLKGQGASVKAGRLRDFLVMTQLAISVGLTVVTLTVMRQMNYMKVKDLGFNQEQVMVIDQINLLDKQQESLKNTMLSLTGVGNASLYTGEPANKSIMSFNTFKTADMESAITINSYFGDDDFISVMGFRMLEGRDFDRNLASDSSAVILNEAAVKALKITNPIGVKINEDQTIIGVVSDFHWESLRHPIAPVAIMRGQKYYQLGLKLTGQPGEWLSQATEVWKKFSPEPLSYHFLDQNFEGILRKEKVLQSAIAFFTGIAMIISCLGLYGLSALTSVQRTKEIGIRKALGASLKDILVLLNTKLLWLLAGGVLVATPVAYLAVNQWLQGFAYHIEPGYGVFVLAVILALGTSWLAVTYHSVRATKINPAETLRWE